MSLSLPVSVALYFLLGLSVALCHSHTLSESLSGSPGVSVFLASDSRDSVSGAVSPSCPLCLGMTLTLSLPSHLLPQNSPPTPGKSPSPLPPSFVFLLPSPLSSSHPYPSWPPLVPPSCPPQHLSRGPGPGRGGDFSLSPEVQTPVMGWRWVVGPQLARGKACTPTPLTPACLSCRYFLDSTSETSLVSTAHSVPRPWHSACPRPVSTIHALAHAPWKCSGMGPGAGKQCQAGREKELMRTKGYVGGGCP